MEYTIENKCICCYGTKIINKNTIVKERCPCCKKSHLQTIKEWVAKIAIYTLLYIRRLTTQYITQHETKNSNSKRQRT
jgi:hypothetical protein